MIKLNGRELIFTSYPNNETVLLDLIKKSNERYVYNNSVELIFESDEDLMRLYFVKKWLDDLHFANIDLLVRYFPYSRMDRSENGSAFTLKYVCEFINSMNFSRVITHENHSFMTEALLEKVLNIPMTSKLFIKALKDITKNDTEKSDYYVYFPDEGASKRYKRDYEGCKILVGSKVRDFSTGEIKGIKVEGADDLKGAKVIIVDDLCSAGGTFYHSALALKKVGAGDVYLVVTHCENTIHKGKLLSGDEIKHIYTTDSILTINHEKITILN